MTRKKIAEYVYTGKPCKNGHIGPRYKNGNCVECLLNREREKQLDPLFAEKKRDREASRYNADIEKSRETQRKRRYLQKDEINERLKKKYATNEAYREERIEQVKKYRLLNPEAVRLSLRGYHEKNREDRNQKSRSYRLRNIDKVLKDGRIFSRNHYLINKEYYWLKKQKRRAVCLRASPAWADVEVMTQVKKDAKTATNALGIQFSVDHMVPLRGVDSQGQHIVCGLNWEGNMQVIPLSSNKSKGNRHWENMP
jgi:hypothetical protein